MPQNVRAEMTMTQIVATNYHAALVRSNSSRNRRGDSRVPRTGVGRAGGMGRGKE